jgi:hypothetical protein
MLTTKINTKLRKLVKRRGSVIYLCSVSHYDPSTNSNGAKARLLEIAIACRRFGVEVVHVNSADTSVYILDAEGRFKRTKWRAGDVRDRYEISAVMIAWSWNFAARDRILKQLGFTKKRPMLIFDSIDFIPMRLQREFEATSMQGRTFNFSIDAERSCVDAADITLAVTDIEAAALRNIGARAVLTIGYAPSSIVSEAAISTRRIGDAQGICGGFFGSKNSANLYSLFRSANLARMSGRFAKFKAFGFVCEYVEELEYMRDLFGRDWFEISGSVANPLECYAEIDVAVHVLAFGSGIKIKNIEALCYGIPLITNDVGAEGIEVGVECGLWRAETLAELCASVDQALAPCRSRIPAAPLLKEEFGHQVNRLVAILKDP